VSGLKELERLHQTLDNAIDQIGGIACTTRSTAAIIVSTQCLFAAGLNTRDPSKREHIARLLRSHQSNTGWPVNDLAQDLQTEWTLDAVSMNTFTSSYRLRRSHDFVHQLDWRRRVASREHVLDYREHVVFRVS
jgi:hypothetical protein